MKLINTSRVFSGHSGFLPPCINGIGRSPIKIQKSTKTNLEFLFLIAVQQLASLSHDKFRTKLYDGSCQFQLGRLVKMITLYNDYIVIGLCNVLYMIFYPLIRAGHIVKRPQLIESRKRLTSCLRGDSNPDLSQQP